jgi:TolA-binding protein
MVSACTQTTPKITDIRDNVGRLDQRIETIQQTQEEERKRREEILAQIRGLVKDNSSLIKGRETIFESSAALPPSRSNDIESVPLDTAIERPADAVMIVPTARRASDAEELFNNAYANYNHGEYSTAAEGFLLAYGLAEPTDLKGRCLYWLGECHYRNREFDMAITCFTQLEIEFPSHPILSSAIFKKGYAYLEKRETQKGKQTLQHLLNTFPESEEASLARDRLRELDNI